MDFSKIISSLKNIAKHSIILLIGIIVGISIVFILEKNIQDNFNKKEISLVDIQIAWIPESEQIIFIDRKTNDVTKLSKDIVFAIFSLKLGSMQKDFIDVTKPVSNANKKSANINSNTPK